MQKFCLQCSLVLVNFSHMKAPNRAPRRGVTLGELSLTPPPAKPHLVIRRDLTELTNGRPRRSCCARRCSWGRGDPPCGAHARFHTHTHTHRGAPLPLQLCFLWRCSCLPVHRWRWMEKLRGMPKSSNDCHTGGAETGVSVCIIYRVPATRFAYVCVNG